MDLFNFAAEAAPEKKTLIEAANVAYDQGSPVLTDSEFDLLAETGLEIDPRNFRRKVQHPFVMGSLDKIRDREKLAKWLPAGTAFAVMPKLDGSSIRLSYVGGTLVEASTRGDAFVGNLVTENIRFTNVLSQLPRPVTIQVRVEAVIKEEHQAFFGEGNLRNIAAGKINAKDPQPEALAKIDCIAIDVIDPTRTLSWREKQSLLETLFPERMRVPVALCDPADGTFPSCDLWLWMEGVMKTWKKRLPYAQDGLVLQVFRSMDDPLPLPKGKIPGDKIALKFGSPEKQSTIRNIEWCLGQHGKLTPVLQIEPVELDGTTVQRISASNYSLLKAAGMGLGAEVMVTKSGDIIPFVTKVVTPSISGLAIPRCPACDEQASLSDSGVDALCVNPECEGNALVRLKKTVGLFGIDFVSGATIETLSSAGYDTLEKLFSLSESDIESLPGFGEKSASYLVSSLKSAKLTEAQVIKSAFLKGIGERKGKALLDHYGSIEDFLAGVMVDGLANIEGFGPIQAQLINEKIGEIADQLHRFRSLGVTILPHEKPAEGGAGRQVVCCTGTCNQYPRKELARVLEEKGFQMVDSVTKETTLLLCADPNGSSSKLTKARKQGILVQSYDEFFA